MIITVITYSASIHRSCIHFFLAATTSNERASLTSFHNGVARPTNRNQLTIDIFEKHSAYAADYKSA